MTREKLPPTSGAYKRMGVVIKEAQQSLDDLAAAIGKLKQIDEGWDCDLLDIDGGVMPPAYGEG